MDRIRYYQDLLILLNPDLSPEVIEAFYAVPRHHFIKRFRVGEAWQEVTPENQQQLAPLLYADNPLVIYGEDEDFRAARAVATISQPSFVLKMLSLLKIEKGQRIFELGTGSGWNAALMGQLVGSKGRVLSMEIIPELADLARKAVAPWPQVEVRTGDGTVFQKEESFDRAIFTAGAYDLPRPFYKQLTGGALMLFVLKNRASVDLLLLLERHGKGFKALSSMPCSFVTVTGKQEELRSNESFQPALSLTNWQLEVFPSEQEITAKTGQWLLKRPESQFLWSKKKDEA